MIEHIINYHKEKQVFTKKIVRFAVRAIIKNEEKILLVHSAKIGDYKFPGGAANKNEEKYEALKREVLEECGYIVTDINEHYLRVIKNRQDRECETALFSMVSDYYLCRVKMEIKD